MPQKTTDVLWAEQGGAESGAALVATLIPQPSPARQVGPRGLPRAAFVPTGLHLLGLDLCPYYLGPLFPHATRAFLSGIWNDQPQEFPMRNMKNTVHSVSADCSTFFLFFEGLFLIQVSDIDLTGKGSPMTEQL